MKGPDIVVEPPSSGAHTLGERLVTAVAEPDNPRPPDDNACTRCGACCAYFRVSFYWAEAAERGLAEDLYQALHANVACMVGTSSKPARCAALAGTVGQQVSCTVYAQRTSTCRDVQIGDDKCLRARAAHGLGAPD